MVTSDGQLRDQAFYVNGEIAQKLIEHFNNTPSVDFAKIKNEADKDLRYFLKNDRNKK